MGRLNSYFIGEYMIIKDLIKNKDYDYIEWRVTAPPQIDEEDIFFGCCKSENGKLIPLDGDSYFDDEIVVKYEEWSKDFVKNGLTLVVETEWM